MSNSSNGTSTGNGKNGRPRLSQEERRVRNQAMLQQFGSLVIVPRSAEVRVMIRMVYPLNKALSKLRRLVGMPIPVATVMKGIEPLQMWLNEVRAWLVESGGEYILTSNVLGNTSVERLRSVNHPDAHVIVPQTDEARSVLEALIRMDQVLMMLRMVDLQTIERDGRLKRAYDLLVGLNTRVAQLCACAQIDYREPKGLGRSDGAAPVEPGVEVGTSVANVKAVTGASGKYS